MSTPLDHSCANAKGELHPLKSVLEVDLRLDLVDAALIEIPARAANDVVNVLIAAKPDKAAQVPLSHLRRFVKPQDVPAHLGPQLSERPWSRPNSSSGSSPAVSRTPSRPQSSQSNSSKGVYSRGNLSRTPSTLSSAENSRPATRSSNATRDSNGSGSSRSSRIRRRRKMDKILYLCTPNDPLSCTKILEALIEQSIIERTDPLPTWFPIKVPLRAPRSENEATTWTESYWPCFYRPSNDYGPWATLVDKATEEISARVAYCMALARQVGMAAQASSQGINAGCVIVENGKVICVRGDARFLGLRPDPSGASVRQENLLGHAALRAIGQIGRLRTSAAASAAASCLAEPEKTALDSRDVLGELTNAMHKTTITKKVPSLNDFLEDPIGHLEREHDQGSAVDGSGYLCLEMEIYLSHEPCLMCCMAMVHSRIRRVIFARRMPKTGGLTAKETGPLSKDGLFASESKPPSLGYGLWYRKELNWRQLAWEWSDYLSHHNYCDGVGCSVHV